MTGIGVRNATTSNERASVLAYTMVTILALAGVVLVSLIPFTAKPVPHRTAGILFGPGFDGRTSVAAVSTADPKAKLIDIRWQGRLVFVDYADVNFPATLQKAGALYMFDAIAAGCHTARRAQDPGAKPLH